MLQGTERLRVQFCRRLPVRYVFLQTVERSQETEAALGMSSECHQNVIRMFLFECFCQPEILLHGFLVTQSFRMNMIRRKNVFNSMFFIQIVFILIIIILIMTTIIITITTTLIIATLIITTLIITIAFIALILVVCGPKQGNCGRAALRVLPVLRMALRLHRQRGLPLNREVPPQDKEG